MAKVVSALERLSGRIGERINEAHIHPGLAEVAAIYARAKSVARSGEYVPGEPTPKQPGNTKSLIGVVYPKRAYGAPYPPHGSMAAPTSLPDADIRRAECGNVVLAVGSGYAAYSADGGNTLAPLNPTAIFPQSAAGGSCCAQAAQYLPGIDRFVWLMQFNTGRNGRNCLRIAAASPQEIICTKCTGWTYWDLSASQHGFNKGINHPDISVRQDFLCVSIGGRETELFVVEIPIEAIRAGGPIHWRFSTQSDFARSRGDRLCSVTG
jgi:hypothetical protein